MAAPGASPGSNHTSPGRESSEDSDDSLPLAQLALKRSAPVASPPQGNASPVGGASSAKKPKTNKKKKKRDPNEPQKPVSAYALFFRDTQAAIKGQNPNASFGEVSKIVASMWDSLEEEQKNNYKKKTETAKKEYLKQLAAYRASLVSKGAMDSDDPFTDKSGGGGGPQQRAIMPAPGGGQGTMSMSPMHDPMGYPQMPPTSTMMGPPLAPRAPEQAMPHGAPMGNSQPMPGMPPNPHMMQMQDQAMHSQYPDQMGSPNNAMCVRNGCQNSPVENPSWDNEYCSSGCVVDHCRDVFTAWVASRQNSYASVK